MSGGPSSAPGFAPRRHVLDNGLVVLFQHNPASPAVTASLSVAAGAVFETPEQAGLASLVARGLTRGTADRDKDAIGEVLDFTGAHMVGSGGRHSAGLVAKCRAADFDEVLALMAECAREPVFPCGEVGKLVGDRLTSIREAEDDPGRVVVDAFRELAYPGGHPYGRPVRGRVATVEGLAADDLRSFHGARYRPRAALLIVVGGVGESRTLEAARRGFGDWLDDGDDGSYRDAQASIPDAGPSGEPRRRVVSMPAKAQVEIALGHPGLRRRAADYYAASMANLILGRFAMGGRLGRSVREEQGMAYYTYSLLDAGIGPGPFLVRAGVQPEHVEPALDSIRREIDRMRSEAVREEELDDARSAAIRSLPRSLESNEGMASVLHGMELHDLGLDYLDRYPELVGSVDAGAILEASRRYLHPDVAAVAVAGPYVDEA